MPNLFAFDLAVPFVMQHPHFLLLACMIAIVIATCAGFPTLLVPHCAKQAAHINGFVLDDGSGRSPDQITSVAVCYNDSFLHIAFNLSDTYIFSDFQNCNDPLYKEDVVEIFLSPNGSFPENYYELEISPNGVLFIADVHNKDLTCGSFTDSMLECASSGVRWSAHRDDQHSRWWATLDFPLSRLNIAPVAGCAFAQRLWIAAFVSCPWLIEFNVLTCLSLCVCVSV